MPKLSFFGRSSDARLLRVARLDPSPGSWKRSDIESNNADLDRSVTRIHHRLRTGWSIFGLPCSNPRPMEISSLADSSSIQVSRYPISATADLTDGQQLEDVVHAAPCDPDMSNSVRQTRRCTRQVNRVNAPTSAGGTPRRSSATTPTSTPLVQFVADGNGGWKWATDPIDVPSTRLPRHLRRQPQCHPAVLPHPGLRGMGALRIIYSPPGVGGDPCQNAGSRNSNVYTSRVGADLVISTPTTSKQLDVTQRSLPFSVRNRTEVERYYRFEIDGANIDDASFSLTDDELSNAERSRSSPLREFPRWSTRSTMPRAPSRST